MDAGTKSRDLTGERTSNTDGKLITYLSVSYKQLENVPSVPEFLSEFPFRRVSLSSLTVGEHSSVSCKVGTTCDAAFRLCAPKSDNGAYRV